MFFTLLVNLKVFSIINNILDFSENFKIKPDQQDWIKNAINNIYELINNTPPDGIIFSEVVKNILQVCFYHFILVIFV